MVRFLFTVIGGHIIIIEVVHGLIKGIGGQVSLLYEAF